MKKVTRLVGGFVAGTTLAVAAFGSAAGADTADDVEQVVENLPAAVDTLLEGHPLRGGGVLPTLEEFATTQGFQDLGFGLTITGVDTVGALVTGTEQFGSLGIGFLLVSAGAIDALNPYLAALDDPATAGDLVNPDDVATIIDQLDDALAAADPDLRTALIEGLSGNLVEDTFLVPGAGTPALIGNGVTAAGILVGETVNNTNYEKVATFLSYTMLVGAGGTASQAHTLEDNLAPVFEALAPATAPIIDALGG